MTIDRRDFLTLAKGGLAAGAALAGGAARAAAPAASTSATTSKPAAALNDWSAVRAEFLLSREHVHLALMLLTSHPRPVREAIERHRRAMDENPADYFEEKFFHADGEVRKAAAAY